MNCPHCQSTTAPGAAYCGVCGTALSSGITSAPPVSDAPRAPGALAPWSRRVLASLIDGLIVGVPTFLWVLYVVVARGSIHVVAQSANASSPTCSYASSGLTCSDGTYVHFSLAALATGLALITLAWAVYVVLSIASAHAATPGMRVLKIKIVDATTLTSLSKGRSALRYATYFALSSLPNLLGVPLLGLVSLLSDLWPLWDQKKQTFQDKAARSIALDLR